MLKTLHILLLFPLALNGQTNYFEYHSLINQAEEHFGNEQFDQALSIYDSAFQKFDYAYVKDYLIAAQISILTNSRTNTIQYLERAFESGYPCACIEKMPIFREYVNTDEWESLKSKENDFRKRYISNISVDLLIEFSKRYRNEQDTKSDSNQQPYQSYVVSNYNRIKYLMDSLVFPSERIIGLDDSMIAPNRKNKTSGLSSCSAGNSKVIPTLLHYDNPITDIGIEKFKKAIELGHLHPRQFGAVFTFEKHYVSRLNKKREINKPDLPDFNFNFPFGKKSKNVEQVNLDRRIFGICSIEIDEKKRVVSKKYKIRTRFGYK
ncbi:MAG: hypothetical protein IH948_08880 [Bacteroidetes bacterium]|nr:hypothetical protein [Bacteroidota bacterium]